MARRNRRGRPVHGVLVLDKPAGVSSNQALQEVKRLYFAAKAGHTGSLDPLATGVLPLCFGEATKFSQFLLEADKSYTTTVIFGATSETGDADGEITEIKDASTLTRAGICEALEDFKGEIEQVPPMYSALKKDGKRLYELARNGETVEREPRVVTISEIRLLDFRPGVKAEADIFMRVSKGTYVRSIAADLGEQLGYGAYIAALRRNGVGPFEETNSVTLDTLRELKNAGKFTEMDELLMPVDSALGNMKKVFLDESSGYYIRKGNPVQIAGSPTSGFVSLMLESGDFIGVGEISDDGLIAPRRLVVD